MGAVISPLTSSGSIRSMTVKGGAAPYILTWSGAEHQSCCDGLQEQQPLQRWLWQSQAVPGQGMAQISGRFGALE